MQIKIFSDGGARGNPGPAAVGGVIRQLDKETKRISRYIGNATNNQAEYRAVIEALTWVKENFANHTSNYTPGMSEKVEIECFLDSELIVEQLNQRYKIKNEGLKPLFWQVRDLVITLGGKVTFKYIPREKNKEADRLVNKAIDDQI